MLLKKLFPKTCIQIEVEARSQAIREYRLVREKSRRASDVAVAKSCINKKVIYCSNEWDDPLFGTVRRYEIIMNAVFLVIQDALQDRECYVHVGSVLFADEKMIDAVLKLNPFERWNLTTGRAFCCNLWEKSYALGEITPPEILKEQLVKAKFIT